jgi:xanthine/CO dehydrogenase XdhC/CoxF family maturation factor
MADADSVATAGVPQVRKYGHVLGSIEVYLEPYESAPTLVVFAATPVAKSLLRWAPEVGFRPLLVETRPMRLAGAEWPAHLSSLEDLSAAVPDDIYVVHTDHDAEDMVAALDAVLQKKPRFIGLVGSRRHTGHHLEALRAKGVPEEVIAKIQSPVGLDLGAVKAEEIALSILAGLVAVRRRGHGGWKQKAGT